jgi:hypothetical protein
VNIAWIKPSVSSDTLVWLCKETPVVNGVGAKGCFQLLVIFEVGCTKILRTFQNLH